MINAVVCVDEAWGIGKDNKLLFSFKEDMARFKALTVGKAVVMGSKTWESLPVKPLPRRMNIVLTHDPSKYYNEDCIAMTIQDFKNWYIQSHKDVFVIGGGEIYKKLLPYCSRVYLTKLYYTFNADTFFPNLDRKKHWYVEEDEKLGITQYITYRFATYKNEEVKSIGE
jgi:dihydrofolate reductase